MKNVYVEFKDKRPIDSDIQKAYDGFECLEFNVIEFTYLDIIKNKMDNQIKKSTFVGCVDTMTQLFRNIGKYPHPINFPDSVIKSGLLNRTVLKMKSDEFISYFIKSKKSMVVKSVQPKLFNTTLITTDSQLSDLEMRNCDVLVSEFIDIVSEHRVFIHDKCMIYSCNYKGDFTISPDFKYVDDLINVYKEQPIAYTIDIGILRDGSMTVVEFNDFWAIGSYGLYCTDYATMLFDRYYEIVSK
jgi:hypothetical protein